MFACCFFIVVCLCCILYFICIFLLLLPTWRIKLMMMMNIFFPWRIKWISESTNDRMWTRQQRKRRSSPLLSNSISSIMSPACCLSATPFSTQKITSRYRRTSGSLPTWRCTTVRWLISSVSTATVETPSFRSPSVYPLRRRHRRREAPSIHQPETCVRRQSAI